MQLKIATRKRLLTPQEASKLQERFGMEFLDRGCWHIFDKTGTIEISTLQDLFNLAEEFGAVRILADKTIEV